MVYRLGVCVRRYHPWRVVLLGSGLVLLSTSALGVYAYRQDFAFAAFVRDFAAGQNNEQSASSGSSHAPGQSNGRSVVKAGSSGGIVTASTTLRKETCRPLGASRASLASANSPELRKLAEYEAVCGGTVASKLSFFVPTPTTVAQAKDYAGEVAVSLKEFAKFNVEPLVIMEPTNNDKNLNLISYRDGAYDSALDTYFSDLKAQGINDTAMGTWVFFPEANLPQWGNLDPVVFTANVTKTVRYQKKYFPGSQATILLDSMTYPKADSWQGGRYASLAPYLKNIPDGLLDSFGLQGFPWSPPAGQAGALFQPSIYLQADLAVEAARILGVKDIWFNTGTFGTAYASRPKDRVDIMALDRQQMLNGTIQLARNLQTKGYSISIHLFAENKSDVSEGIDWSYWSDPRSLDDNAVVFKTFQHDTRSTGIKLWLFDAN